MPDLTEDDYDALYAVVNEEIPRISREIFPKIVEQLANRLSDIDFLTVSVATAVATPSSVTVAIRPVDPDPDGRPVVDG